MLNFKSFGIITILSVQGGTEKLYGIDIKENNALIRLQWWCGSYGST